MSTEEERERVELLAALQVSLAAAGYSAEAQALLNEGLAKSDTGMLRKLAAAIARYGSEKYWNTWPRLGPDLNLSGLTYEARGAAGGLKK